MCLLATLRSFTSRIKKMSSLDAFQNSATYIKSFIAQSVQKFRSNKHYYRYYTYKCLLTNKLSHL